MTPSWVMPKQMDPVTRWERVEAGPEKSCSYVYTVNKSLTDAEKQAVRDSVTSKVATLPDMQRLLAAGATVWFKYYDPSGKSVLEFPVKK